MAVGRDSGCGGTLAARVALNFDPCGTALVPRRARQPRTRRPGCRFFNAANARPYAVLSETDWQALAAAARDASRRAYCPYSRFAVGAAVRTADGRVFSGCNVENASFGLTICAERNAIFQAVAAGARDIVAVALYTPAAEPATPCGACRQVMAQFGAPQVRCDGAGGTSVRYGLDELLPQRFRLEP